MGHHYIAQTAPAADVEHPQSRARNTRPWATLYLSLSALSGFLEVGVLVHASRGRSPFLDLPLFAVAYQIGAALCYPISLPPAAYVVSGIAGAVCILSLPTSTATAFLAIVLTATALQRARDLASKRCRTTTFSKRAARVFGFLAAPWLAPWMIAAASITATAVAATTGMGRLPQAATSHTARARASLLALTMLVHQSHYFSYCCFLPWIFITVLALPLPLVGAAFALGWVSYCFAPLLFQRFPPGKVFITGHLLVTIALCALYICTHQLLPVLAAWFFSGFGGGTVYCLRDLNSRRGSLAADLDSWENLGHVSGAVIALIAVTASNTPRCAFAVAAILALSTAILGRQAAQPPSTQEVSK